MQARQAGVDGIYLFNAQDVSDETLFNELGDPDLLRALPKVYVSTARSVGNADFWVRDGVKRFLERSFVCPSRPRALAAGETVELPLPVGDEAETSRFVLKLVLKEGAATGLRAACNGTDLALRAGERENECVAAVPGSALAGGGTLFAVSASVACELADLQLWVFPPAPAPAWSRTRASAPA